MNRSSAVHTDPQEVRRALELVTQPGDVFEIRCLNATTKASRSWPATWAGYFDDPAKAAAALADITASGIYFTPNPIDAALLARAANRIRKAEKGGTTTDRDVTARRWLLIDLDAKRPAGISATDAQHDAALGKARTIRDTLAGEGWPRGVFGDSGNGGHLMIRVDLPTDDGGLVERVLHRLAERFDDDVVKVDTSVHNPARIWKLYGTPVRKGDHTADRPHRPATLIDIPEVIQTIDQEALERFAPPPPEAANPTRPASTTSPSTDDYRLDVQDFIDRHQLDVSAPTAYDGTGQRWTLHTDPMGHGHDDGSCFIIQFANGAIAAGSRHDSATWKWKDLRAKFEPRRKPAPSTPPIPSRDEAVKIKPTPLPDDIPGVMPFDAELLPASLRLWVNDITERIQCPPDFPAVAAVICLASVVGKKVCIAPKQHDSWRVVPPLWGGGDRSARNHENTRDGRADEGFAAAGN